MADKADPSNVQRTLFGGQIASETAIRDLLSSCLETEDGAANVDVAMAASDSPLGNGPNAAIQRRETNDQVSKRYLHAGIGMLRYVHGYVFPKTIAGVWIRTRKMGREDDVVWCLLSLFVMLAGISGGRGISIRHCTGRIRWRWDIV